MAYCRECGQKLVEGARFCTECGTKVTSTEIKADNEAPVACAEAKTGNELSVVAEAVQGDKVTQGKYPKCGMIGFWTMIVGLLVGISIVCPFIPSLTRRHKDMLDMFRIIVVPTVDLGLIAAIVLSIASLTLGERKKFAIVTVSISSVLLILATLLSMADVLF